MNRTLIDVQELSKRLGRIAVGTLYNWVSQARRGYGPFVNGEGVLSALGGLLAFSTVHLCDKCYSLLTTLRGSADDSETNVPDRDNSAKHLFGDRDEREVEA